MGKYFWGDGSYVKWKTSLKKLVFSGFFPRPVVRKSPHYSRCLARNLTSYPSIPPLQVLLAGCHCRSSVKMSSNCTNDYYSDPGVKGGTCPLCYKKRRGDTVLPASGLVFCYTCIVHNLRREARCPITKLPAKEEQLIRIFTQQWLLDTLSSTMAYLLK